MSHDAVVCVTVRCGSCFVAARDTAGPRHWPSLAAAIAELSGPSWGWAATDDDQTCCACLARRRCRSVGHDWGGWTELPDLGLEEDLLLRVCERCGVDQIAAADCLDRPTSTRSS